MLLLLLLLYLSPNVNFSRVHESVKNNLGRFPAGAWHLSTCGRVPMFKMYFGPFLTFPLAIIERKFEKGNNCYFEIAVGCYDGCETKSI